MGSDRFMEGMRILQDREWRKKFPWAEGRKKFTNVTHFDVIDNRLTQYGKMYATRQIASDGRLWWHHAMGNGAWVFPVAKKAKS